MSTTIESVLGLATAAYSHADELEPDPFNRWVLFLLAVNLFDRGLGIMGYSADLEVDDGRVFYSEADIVHLDVHNWKKEKNDLGMSASCQNEN